jgi:hypothetical protein
MNPRERGCPVNDCLAVFCAHAVTGDINGIHIKAVESIGDHLRRALDLSIVTRPLDFIVTSADTR